MNQVSDILQAIGLQERAIAGRGFLWDRQAEKWFSQRVQFSGHEMFKRSRRKEKGRGKFERVKTVNVAFVTILLPDIVVPHCCNTHNCCITEAQEQSAGLE